LDADVQFREGVDLLQGAKARTEGRRALELIEAASAQGHPEAAAMSALFESMGTGRPQSWPKAIEALERAAKLGSQSAQGQLRALSERGLEQLFQPPPRQKLSDRPRILAFPGFASFAECDWVVARARERLQPAHVVDPAAGGNTYHAVRDNSLTEFQLPDMDVVLEVLRTRISTAIRLPVPIFEAPQVLHYSVGQQFREHHDFLDPSVAGFAEQLRRFGQRIATVLVYLNDEYAGGETVFPRLGVSYRGRKGDALFFTNVDSAGRGDPLTTHAGKPPTEGEKWVLSQWIRDRQPAQDATAV
jgi:prolyl 4-hydroxylase